MLLINALELSHQYAVSAVAAGDRVIDATAGKGRDTLLLSGAVGEKGSVYAFDIQKTAIDLVKTLLDDNKINNVITINCGHEHMDEFVEPGISCVMFNLGYLPGNDHSLHTQGPTTIQAIEKALVLLKKNGIITIVIYHGGDTGFAEKDMVLEYCSSLNQNSYSVMKVSYENQKNNPPIFICIEKL